MYVHKTSFTTVTMWPQQSIASKSSNNCSAIDSAVAKNAVARSVKSTAMAGGAESPLRSPGPINRADVWCAGPNVV